MLIDQLIAHWSVDCSLISWLLVDQLIANWSDDCSLSQLISWWAITLWMDHQLTGQQVNQLLTGQSVSQPATHSAHNCKSAVKLLKAKFMHCNSRAESNANEKILCSPSLAYDSAHVKYGIWTLLGIRAINLLNENRHRSWIIVGTKLNRLNVITSDVLLMVESLTYSGITLEVKNACTILWFPDRAHQWRAVSLF